MKTVELLTKYLKGISHSLSISAGNKNEIKEALLNLIGGKCVPIPSYIFRLNNDKWEIAYEIQNYLIEGGFIKQSWRTEKLWDYAYN